MQVTTVDIVTLPDATTWLRRGDRMFRVELPAGVLDQAPGGAYLHRDDADALGKTREPRAHSQKPRAKKEVDGRKGGRVSPDPEAVKQARIRFETTHEKLTTIAEACGLKYDALFKIAKRDGWTRQALVRS